MEIFFKLWNEIEPYVRFFTLAESAKLEFVHTHGVVFYWLLFLISCNAKFVGLILHHQDVKGIFATIEFAIVRILDWVLNLLRSIVDSIKIFFTNKKLHDNGNIKSAAVLHKVYLYHQQHPVVEFVSTAVIGLLPIPWIESVLLYMLLQYDERFESIRTVGVIGIRDRLLYWLSNWRIWVMVATSLLKPTLTAFSSIYNSLSALSTVQVMIFFICALLLKRALERFGTAG